MGRDSAATREQTRAKYVTANITSQVAEHSSLTIIYIATVVALFLLGATAFVTESVFFIDAVVSIAVVSAVYYYRKHLIYSWEGAALAAAGWLMNMLGTLGAYDIYIAGLGWDKALHFVSILGVTLLAHAYLDHSGRFNTLELAVIAFLIAQGFGAINEMAEFIGTHYFGAGQGLFGMMNGLTEPANKFAQYDTHWDIITNTVAAMGGIAYAAWRRAQIYKTKTASDI